MLGILNVLLFMSIVANNTGKLFPMQQDEVWRVVCGGNWKKVAYGTR